LYSNSNNDLYVQGLPYHMVGETVVEALHVFEHWLLIKVIL